MQFSIPDGTPSPSHGDGPFVVAFPTRYGPDIQRFTEPAMMLSWVSGYCFDGKTCSIPMAGHGDWVQVSA